MASFAPSHAKQVELLPTKLTITRAVRESSAASKTVVNSPVNALHQAFWSFRLVGSLHDALAMTNIAIEYFRTANNAENTQNSVDHPRLGYWVICQAFVLWDMGRVLEATDAAHEARAMLTFPVNSESDDTEQCHQNLLFHGIIQSRLMRYSMQNQEALKPLREVLSNSGWANYRDYASAVFNLHCGFLYAELALVHLECLGNGIEALQEANSALEMCRRGLRAQICNVDPEAMEDENYFAASAKYTDYLTHTLTVLSKCLAAVGQDAKALLAAKEATWVYSSNTHNIRGDSFFLLREQELGANAFHSLSLRLGASGQLEEALSNAEKATGLYRELVLLAPGHLPSLASSLQNLGSLSWRLGRQDEAIIAFKERVTMSRRASHNNSYFLRDFAQSLDQLVSCLSDRGYFDHAVTAFAEFVEVQTRIARTETQETEVEDVLDSSGPLAFSVTETSSNMVTEEPKHSEVEEDIPSSQTVTLGKPQPASAVASRRKTRLVEFLTTPIEVKLSIRPVDIFLLLLAVLGMVLAMQPRVNYF
ncbi:hypothetical protein FB451DRAFT_403222 [Mycena latifolia]|nr:hypothetical protein FB451DRAFT_403222 [Mycena latifolia]